MRMTLLLRMLIFGVVIIASMRTGKAQSFLNIVQMNGGLISQPTADLYLGKLDYLPQFKLSEDRFRIGANIGAFYSRKKVAASFGVNTTTRLYRFSILNDNLGLGGIYLRAGHEWGTDSQKILSGALLFEFTQVGFNITYGRDYNEDSNWISTGFFIMFSKSTQDDFE